MYMHHTLECWDLANYPGLSWLSGIKCQRLPCGVSCPPLFSAHKIESILCHHLHLWVSVCSMYMLMVRKISFLTNLIFVLVLGFYMLAWTPYGIVSMWSAFGDEKRIPNLAFTFLAFFAKLSFIFNPCVYCFNNPRHRWDLVLKLSRRLGWSCSIYVSQ